MCSGPRVQAQRCWDTDGAADGGGQQRAAGTGIIFVLWVFIIGMLEKEKRAREKQGMDIK